MADGNIIDGNTFAFSNVPTSGTFSPSNYIHYAKNTEIRRNKFQNFFSGIYLGKTTSTNDENFNISIYNNYFSSTSSVSDKYCGIHIENPNTTAANIRIYNNTFYFKNGSYGCLHFETSNAPNGVYVYNNLFYVPSSAIPSTSESALIYYDNSTPAKLAEIDYNYYNPGSYDVACRNTTCYSTLAAFKGYDHDNRVGTNGDDNSLSDVNYSDPLLVNPNSHNLDLQATSPMLAKAPVVYGIDRDINSYARPTGGSTPIAIGADDDGSTFLPVSWLSFNIYKKEDNIAVLIWKTASELNNDYFVVEKSTDGINFYELSKVKGSGTSNQVNEYVFTDYALEAPVNYYRIKQVDYDGKFGYSPTRFVKVNALGNSSFNVSLLKNPLSENDDLLFEINSNQSQSVTIELYSIEGKLLKTEKFYIEQGNYLYYLNNVQLNKSGMYFCVFINETNERALLRFVLK